VLSRLASESLYVSGAPGTGKSTADAAGLGGSFAVALLQADSSASYSSNHVLFARDQTLMAQHSILRLG
jgi:hypothetical protein